MSMKRGWKIVLTIIIRIARVLLGKGKKDNDS